MFIVKGLPPVTKALFVLITLLFCTRFLDGLYDLSLLSNENEAVTVKAMLCLPPPSDWIRSPWTVLSSGFAEKNFSTVTVNFFASPHHIKVYTCSVDAISLRKDHRARLDKSYISQIRLIRQYIEFYFNELNGRVCTQIEYRVSRRPLLNMLKH